MSAKCGNHLMDSSYRDGEKIFDFCVRANFLKKMRQNRHLYNYSLDLTNIPDLIRNAESLDLWLSRFVEEREVIKYNAFGVVRVSFFFFSLKLRQNFIKFNVFIQGHVVVYFVTTTCGCI